ncbi:MAG: ribosomal RNA small subunit methyltransferase A [Clostridia bacterium]|nr:ribosomal RNA small subunit methyltransferase A [Clostridia bacterium]MBR6810539.1 ribosomal RNA small subunit methyltransferase A [Clostridia bacterium]
MREGNRKGNKKSQPFHHKHSLGQNFITDDALFEQLVTLSGVAQDDNVLEIGAGAGGMTKVLSKRCGKVISVEVDGTLIPILRVALHHCENVELVHGDVMRLNLKQVTASFNQFHIVANIPYYLTTDLMNMLLTSALPIESINVMVQAEAAQRMVAKPGEEGWGMLAVRAQYHYRPQIVLDVPSCMFTPPPKVDSAFVTMQKREQPAVEVQNENMFFKVAKAAFAMRRKTMANNLIASFRVSREQAEMWLFNCGLEKNVRGETMSLQDFANLANCAAEYV